MTAPRFALALVTGASSGIGEELCHLLAGQGINLLVTGRNQDKLNALVRQLESKVRVFSFVADLSTPEGCQHVVNHIQQHVPDLIINNAGLGLYGEAISHPIEKELEIVDVNVRAVMQFTLTAAKALQQRNKAGSICNIASAIAFYVAPSTAVYAASKSFVVNFSQALDLELKPYHIRVLTSCPGVVMTEFAKRAGKGKYNPQPEAAMSAKFVAEEIWQQIKKGESLSIIDWKYRLAYYVSKLLPQSWIAHLIQKSILSRGI